MTSHHEHPSASPPTVAVIPGEGAAPEAVRATLRVLAAADADVRFVHPPVGERAERTHGSTFPDAARAMIDAADTTLFGATSGASGIALFYLRFGKATYANVRPARFLRGARSPLAEPSGIDLVIVRENLEGLYVGLEGELDALAALELRYPGGGPLHAQAGRWALKIATPDATRRVARHAFELARSRARDGRAGHAGRVTVAAKHNILRVDGLFHDVCMEVAAEYPDVEVESGYIDNVARRLVAEPRSLDVVLTANLYGDILSDEAAALVGGLGMMGSGCYGDDYAYFEPPHGTAPDLVGTGRINPTAQLLSAVLMLRYLGRNGPAERIERAITALYERAEVLPPDQGGSAGTEQVADALIALLPAPTA